MEADLFTIFDTEIIRGFFMYKVWYTDFNNDSYATQLTDEVELTPESYGIFLN